MRAQEDGQQQQQQQQKQQDDAAEERRLEALEASARARRGVKADQAEALRGGGRPASSSASSSGMVEWREGELFPQGE